MQSEPSLDQIISKRLVFKYERVLTKFASDYIGFLNFSFQNPNPNQQTKQSLLADLASLQYQVFKYQSAYSSLLQDDQEIQESIESANNAIQSSKEQIERLKQALTAQKKIMSNKNEFNSIASQISIYGKQSEVLRQIEQARQEIEAQNKAEEKDEEHERKKESYFLTAVSSVQCLSKSMEPEDE